MSLSINKKEKIISDFGRCALDSGSTEVQIAILTDKINNLQVHFANNKKDCHSRRGLLRMVSKRRKLLDYIKDKNIVSYNQLIERLSIRR
ncbi:30S ribosomal protein S15 [Candidatus Palibaumannia cicadellinicola]|uniref:Small ribosomal subunit protein uS15 n=1 Tax=Candidatus Palibaumannia cicadellinicola TaxID=186490 RepID=A0A0K2BLE8_9GAMM|nr:30S ribosomal protein S15 [Candidatus Baumannia cicadellinicola]AKZ66150.1 SSU ribosomal protein S15p (S13e) [Candidatus Baumannia cicadellinicola]